MKPEANGRIWEALIKIGTALAWTGAGAIIAIGIDVAELKATSYTKDEAHRLELSTIKRFEALERDLGSRLSELDTKVEVVIAILEDLRKDNR